MSLIVMLTAAAVPSLAADTVRTGGTGASLGLVRALAVEFMQANPDIKIEPVPSLGSSGGIKAAGQGAIDLAFASRPLKPEERSMGLVDSKWVTTPFTLVKGNDSLAHDITTNELDRIYSGAVTTWPKGERIRIVVRPEAESDTRIVKGISPVMEKAIDSLLQMEGVLMATTDQDCLNMVSRIPGALGWATLTQIKSENRNVSVFSFNGVAPTPEALAAGKYPLEKPIYLITKSTLSRGAKLFLDYLRSDAVKGRLPGLGTLPL